MPKHPYPKWLQWLLPFEQPEYRAIEAQQKEASEHDPLDDLAELLGDEYVDRMRNL